MYFKEIYPSATTANSVLTRVEKYVVWASLKHRKKMVLSAEAACDPSLNLVQIYGNGNEGLPGTYRY